MKQTVPKDFRPNLSHTFYFLRRQLFEKIHEYAHIMNGRMLDFGCGRKPYQSLFTKVSEYIGLDYNGEGHGHQNEQIDVFYDGRTIPFENDYFDSIFSSEVFEHVFNLPEILPELCRVLKKNGRILVTCPFVWNEHEVPNDYARYTRFALADMFEKNGFKVLVQDKSGDYLSAVFQLRVQYLSDVLLPAIPLLGKRKFFITNIRPPAVMLANGWFSMLHAILPKPQHLYLNNIFIAEKQ
jgi:SAM-dependent methyltransferase